MDGWAWVFANGEEDHDYWREEARIQEWIEAGAPTAMQMWEELQSRGDAPSVQPDGEANASATAPEVPTHAMLAVTRRQAGALLGGKSEDWIDQYVIPAVKTVRESRSVLIPTRELERWVHENSSMGLRDG